MTTHEPHPDADIQHALNEVRQDETSSPPQSWLSPGGIFWQIPMPMTTSPIILFFWMVQNLFWGVRSAFAKCFAAALHHPWKAALGVGVVVAAGQLCHYFAGIILATLLVLAVRSESRTRQTAQ